MFSDKTRGKHYSDSEDRRSSVSPLDCDDVASVHCRSFATLSSFNDNSERSDDDAGDNSDIESDGNRQGKIKKATSFVTVDHFNSNFDACPVFMAGSKSRGGGRAEIDEDWLLVRTPCK